MRRDAHRASGEHEVSFSLRDIGRKLPKERLGPGERIPIPLEADCWFTIRPFSYIGAFMRQIVGFAIDPRLAALLGDSYRSTEQAIQELVNNAGDADGEEVIIV